MTELIHRHAIRRSAVGKPRGRLRGMQYREAGPQLLLQAFLQRVVNGGGRMEREYPLGQMRTDLLIVWPPGRFAGTAEPGTQTRRYVVECKVLRGRLEAAIGRDVAKPWDERIFRCEETLEGRTATVWGA